MGECCRISATVLNVGCNFIYKIQEKTLGKVAYADMPVVRTYTRAELKLCAFQ